MTTLRHEVMTPLTVIRGSALTLARDDVELSDQARATLVNGLLQQTERLEDVVQELLTAASLSSGAFTVHHATVNVDQIARDRCTRWLQRHPRHKVRFLADANRHEVVADPACLTRVLDSLLDNAAKHAHSDRPVKLFVHAPCASHDGEQSSSRRVLVSVEDHGRGIPEAERERVFAPLFRRDADMRYSAGGLGLGLFTARLMVRTMGGDLWVEEVADGGARFVLALRSSAVSAGHAQPRLRARA